MGLGRWTTGSYISGGTSNRMRLAWRMDQSPSSVGSGTSSVSLRLRVRVETRYPVYDSVNTFSLSGSWPSTSTSVSISHSSSSSWSSQNRTIVYDRTITVSTSYTSTRTRSFSASMSGVAVFGGRSVSVSGSRTVPRRPISPPNTPSNVSASRNSDSSHRITWSQSTSSGRPVSSFRIQRRTFGQNGWGGWSTRTSNVSSGSRAWTDTGTRNNRVYQWRVVAVNSAGSRTSSSTSSLWTTPWIPTNVSARRISGDRIRLDWRDSVAYGSSDFQIRHSENGGSWSDIATHSGGSYGSDQSWTHSNPNLASTHEYAIRSRTTSMSPTLSSEWVYSDVIQLAAPPNAPTITGPTVAVDAQANPVRVTWRHNPTDGSDQDSYEMEWRYQYGGPHEWTSLGREYSEDEFREFPPGYFDNNQVVEVRLRTWGAHADPGPYSSQFTFRASDPPTVAINYPDPVEPVHHEAHITTQWEYAGEVGQSHWEAELYRPDPNDLEDQGTLMERRTGTGTASSVRFNRRLPDGTLWRIRVRVRAGDGLWSQWDQVDFEVSYPLPAVPSGEGSWDSDMGAVTLNVDAGEIEEDEEPTALVQMYRPGQAFFEGPAREIATARAAAEEFGLPEGFYVENLVTNPRGRATEDRVIRRNLAHIGDHSAGSGATVTLQPDGSLLSVGLPSGSNYVRIRSSAGIPLVEGEEYTASIYARADDDLISDADLMIQWYGSDGYMSQNSRGERVPVSQDGWSRVSARGTVPEGATHYNLWVERKNAQPGDRWLVRDVMFEHGSEVQEYFDGDTWDGDPDLSPQWEGEPHASISRLVIPVPVGWDGSGLYYSENMDAVAIPAGKEQADQDAIALQGALENYTDAPVEWTLEEPTDHSVMWVDPAGVAREWVDAWERAERNMITNPRGRDSARGWSGDGVGYNEARDAVYVPAGVEAEPPAEGGGTLVVAEFNESTEKFEVGHRGEFGGYIPVSSSARYIRAAVMMGRPA